MIHHATEEFWQAYKALPQEVQRAADKAFELLRAEPRHPSLHLKKLRNGYWSARVGIGYRVLAFEGHDCLVWFWIGAHAEYDRY